MTKMRGLGPFPKLWNRRTTLVLPGKLICNLMSFHDLVKAKKTQRDKDWPMIRRLLEAHYFTHQAHPTWAQTAFWFRELRTPDILIEVAQRYPRACSHLIAARPLLKYALSGNVNKVAKGPFAEETIEREKDRLYWLPLRKELENLRHSPQR
jgi:hypothetical protein